VERNCDEFLANLEKVNPKDNFESTMNKWRKITTIVANDGNSKHAQSGPTCKDSDAHYIGISNKSMTTCYKQDTKHLRISYCKTKFT
jgi:hypothetical protein